MDRMKILLPVDTVAAWGGLQDWAVGMVRGLAQLGCEVSLIANNPRIVAECQDSAARAILVDWSESAALAKEAGLHWDLDVVFAQPFHARVFGLQAAAAGGIPFVYMAHGTNADAAYIWGSLASRFLVASASLVSMFHDFCLFKDTPVDVLPNGFPDWVAQRDLIPLQERLGGGRAKIVLAARLMPDKLSQVQGVELLVEALQHDAHISGVDVVVMGDGPSRMEFEQRLESVARRGADVTINMAGWASQERVLEELSNAAFSVAGGVTGAQSLALGTPCLGSGIRGLSGVSTPQNIEQVLGTNFGDHSSVGASSTEQVMNDARWMMDSGNYATFLQEVTSVMRRERKHSDIARLALKQLTSATL